MRNSLSRQFAGIFGILLAVSVIISCDGDDPPNGADTTPPTVVSTSPAAGAVDVAADASITATFSEEMDSASITATTFSLDHSVTGMVTYASNTATFTPSADLLVDSTYTVTITTGVKDLVGNAMQSNHVWEFTTSVGSLARLVERFVEAINSNDTAAMGVELDEDFVGWGFDKQCFLNMIAEQAGACLDCAISMTIQETAVTGDKGRIISLLEYHGGWSSEPSRIDTTWAILRDTTWYIWGDRKMFSASAFVVRFSHNNEYYVEMMLADNLHRAIEVCVSGTGLLGCQPATFEQWGECSGGGRWWGPNVLLGSTTPPPLPAAYNFQVITADNTYNLTASVAVGEYMAEYAEPIYPVETDTVDAGVPFTFEWHRIPGLDSIRYGIQLDGHFWQEYDDANLDDSTLVYDGPMLTAGQHSYAVSAKRYGSSAHSLKYVNFYVR